jgi:hypothetical protein
VPRQPSKTIAIFVLLMRSKTRSNHAARFAAILKQRLWQPSAVTP